MTELLASAGVESLVLVDQKRDLGKTRSSSVVLWGFNFALFPSELTAVEQFLRACSLEIGF